MFGHHFSSRPQVIQGNFQGRMPSLATEPHAGAFASRQVAPHVQTAIQRYVHPAHQQHAANQPSVAQPRRLGNAFEVPRTFQFRPSVMGRSLPAAVQQKMESFFGTDFSNVRIHEGPQPKQIGALAFTIGNAIYFAPGQYMPHSRQGQRLLGHELAHVMQQRTGQVRNPFGSGVAIVQDPRMEAEADRLGMQASMQPARPPIPHPKDSVVQRSGSNTVVQCGKRKREKRRRAKEHHQWLIERERERAEKGKKRRAIRRFKRTYNKALILTISAPLDDDMREEDMDSALAVLNNANRLKKTVVNNRKVDRDRGDTTPLSVDALTDVGKIYIVAHGSRDGEVGGLTPAGMAIMLIKAVAQRGKGLEKEEKRELQRTLWKVTHITLVSCNSALKQTGVVNYARELKKKLGGLVDRFLITPLTVTGLDGFGIVDYTGRINVVPSQRRTAWLEAKKQLETELKGLDSAAKRKRRAQLLRKYASGHIRSYSGHAN